tara:strand:- start:486 stop:1118 length:633 start_codon:yes stop_codon:yes gene_type:complete
MQYFNPGNPHGLLYTGDPDLPLEDSYPFIGMAGMGLGGLLTKAAMKTPVRALVRKEPTLPKVTIKSKRPVKKPGSRRARKADSKRKDRQFDRAEQHYDDQASRHPLDDSDWSQDIVGTLKKGREGYDGSRIVDLGKYFTKGEQRSVAKIVRKRMGKRKEVEDFYAKRNKESKSELLKKYKNETGREIEDYADAMDYEVWMDDYLNPPEFY